MKKTTIIAILFYTVFLGVYNSIFFICGGANTVTAGWIAYGFIHFAYFMVVISNYLGGKSKSKALFGVSLHLISLLYFGLQLSYGTWFTLLSNLAKTNHYKVSLVIQILLLGIYSAAFLGTFLANARSEEDELRHDEEVAYIKDSASRIKYLVGKVSDKRANREIEKAYDALHASPALSNRSESVV